MIEEKTTPCLIGTLKNIYAQNKHNVFNLLWIEVQLGTLDIGAWSGTCSAELLAGFRLPA